VDGTRAVASPTQTLLGLAGATTIRPWIYDILIGCSAPPADNAIQWFCQRFTAAGTGTAVTPTAIDPGDPGATSSAARAHTVEPTYTAGSILWHCALNQRATHRFQFDPDGPLVVPAAANNGVGLYPVQSSFTGTVDGMIYFSE
jgi:hypothetical protein